MVPMTPELGDNGDLLARNSAVSNRAPNNLLDTVVLGGVDQAVPGFKGMDDGLFQRLAVVRAMAPYNDVRTTRDLLVQVGGIFLPCQVPSPTAGNLSPDYKSGVSQPGTP
jgi:hypothetical protein